MQLKQDSKSKSKPQRLVTNKVGPARALLSRRSAVQVLLAVQLGLRRYPKMLSDAVRTRVWGIITQQLLSLVQVRCPSSCQQPNTTSCDAQPFAQEVDHRSCRRWHLPVQLSHPSERQDKHGPIPCRMLTGTMTASSACI